MGEAYGPLASEGPAAAAHRGVTLLPRKPRHPWTTPKTVPISRTLLEVVMGTHHEVDPNGREDATVDPRPDEEGLERRTALEGRETGTEVDPAR